MQSIAQTVDEYINTLPPDRKEAIVTLRNLIRKNLPKGYEEGMQYGMISYYIPLERYPDTYNKQPLSYMALASQQNYMSLYHMGIYGHEDAEQWLRNSFTKAGKKLDMGKSCIRFKKIEDVPIDVIATSAGLLSPDEFIERYEQAHRK